MFTFYILYSSTRNRYYVGYTGDNIEERLRKHNSNHSGFTGKTGDWKVVYTERYQTKEEAYKRERKVKGCKSR
jgi:putative endonuclease